MAKKPDIRWNAQTANPSAGYPTAQREGAVLKKPGIAWSDETVNTSQGCPINDTEDV